MFKKFFPYFKGYGLAAVLCPLLMILEVLADVMIPALMAKVINEGVMPQNLALVYRYGAYMVAVALFGLAMGALASYVGAVASQGFGANLRAALYGKIQTLSYTDLDRVGIPSLITRLTNDSEMLARLAQMALRISIRSPFMFIFALIMTLRMNPKLSLIFAAAIPLTLLIIKSVISKASPLFQAMQTQLDRLNQRVRENLTAIRVVKSFVREAYETERFEKENESLYTRSLEAFAVVVKMMPAMMLIIGMCIIAALWYGRGMVLDGSSTVGDLYSFIMYVTQVMLSVMMMNMVIMNFSRGEASAKRVAEVLDLEAEAAQAEPAAAARIARVGELTPDEPFLRFDHVSFTYPGAAVPAINQLSFSLAKGQELAVIGSTGSGKTSLVQLLLRLYREQEGRIELCGRELSDYSLAELRSRLALVSQQNLLFSGSLRENLLWGCATASDEEIWQVLEIAQIADYVRQQPEGLELAVEQAGSNFSGGQRQRLCIARSLLQKADLLILDDASSALDLETERRLHEALAAYRPGLTRISIAQRLASIRRADQILVLDEGRLVGLGSDAELLANCRVYQEIAASQGGHLE